MRSLIVTLFCVMAIYIFAPQIFFAQWATDPSINNAICTAADNQLSPNITSDGSGGAIITWQDLRNGNYDIYAQRINASGAVQWTTDGVAICTATNHQTNPTIVSDGSGGAIITWQDTRGSNWDIYAQRINASGQIQWTANGVVICAATYDQTNPTIVSDGSGGAIITWQDNRGSDFDIYAQRINASGAVQWTANGVAICTATGNQYIPTIVSDGSGGAIITWTDYRNGNGDIYAQRINASGTTQWTGNGVAICTAANNQTYPTIVSDGSGGAIITWMDYKGSDNDIYAQRISASGTVQWTTDGIAICSTTNDQFYPTIVSDGTGGAIITWFDNRNGSDYDIYTQRISASGVVQWTGNGVAICTAAEFQQSPTMVSDGSGGAIITWQDFRSGSNWDIYAQQINASGTVQWTANGVAICTAADFQKSPTMVSDGSGGAIITWQDIRSGSNWDIYAQRVDRLGNLYPAPWITRAGDVANDQGGKIRLLWNASNLDTWSNYSVQSYTIKLGVKSTGLLGKTSVNAGIVSTDGIYWQTAGTVAADWSSGYSAIVATSADSGLQGVPWYYFQVIAKSPDALTFWTSNIDSGYSLDNIPPVGISGEYILAKTGGIVLGWNKDRVDPDLMGYQIYRSNTGGFPLNESTKLAMAFDSTYTDAAANNATSYYYRIAAVDVHGNQGTPSAELNITAIAVELSSFTCSISCFNVLLQWRTETEINIYGFEIERRTISSIQSAVSSWQKIGFVQGSGTSNSPNNYSYADNSITSGTYAYRLKQVDNDGSFKYSKELEATIEVPRTFALSQNYPNPFNPTTTITFTLAQDGMTTLKVYDMLGREVATLVNEELKAGVLHQATLNASKISSGIYFYRLESGNNLLIKKLVLTK